MGIRYFLIAFGSDEEKEGRGLVFELHFPLQLPSTYFPLLSLVMYSYVDNLLSTHFDLVVRHTARNYSLACHCQWVDGYCAFYYRINLIHFWKCTYWSIIILVYYKDTNCIIDRVGISMD